ncbi:hypothetical protein G3M48_007206 [Beauveria asiatica]|uniref:Uncharacterized protein n=1 Tax=Beauveria asiatica TaxID=1069075 RepID=A0AAW0S543_9HYPO
MQQLASVWLAAWQPRHELPVQAAGVMELDICTSVSYGGASEVHPETAQMSYSASQFEDITAAIHCKNGKKIPKDQEALLVKDSSWIHQLRTRPHGVVNVPDHVLQTVTTAHEARSKQMSSHAVQPVEHATPEMAEPSQSCSTSESSPERHLSGWSASPDERRPEQHERSASPDERRPEQHERSASPHERRPEQHERSPSPDERRPEQNERSASPDERLPEQNERSASPHERRPEQHEKPESSLVEETPHPQHARAQYRRASLIWKRVPCPPLTSSAEEEEEMEVRVPCGKDDQYEQRGDAAEDHDEVPRRYSNQQLQRPNLQVTNTPPCAQPGDIVIPATAIAGKATWAGHDARPRPVKRFKPVHLESPIKPREGGMVTRSGRMQSLKHLEVTETQETAVSSSIVPATLTQTQTQNVTSATEKIAQDAPAERHDSESSAPVAEEAPSLSAELLSVKSHLSGTEEGMEDGRNHTPTPLDEFAAAYPDYYESYSGTQRNFVKACLCLEYLRAERCLRDYLYDEFIRLFTYKYLDYVCNARPDQEPLPAVEWFNIQKGRPLYLGQIINNDNLKHVLEFYDEEVAAIRSLVVQSSEVETTESAASPRTTESDTASPTPLPEAAQDMMEVDTVAPETEIDPDDVVSRKMPAQDEVEHQRLISQPEPIPPSNALVGRNVASTPKPAAFVASSATIPQAASPQLGSRVFSTVPPSSARSNAPVGTQYMQQLFTMQAPAGEEEKRLRRERIRAAVRNRASNSARSVSSKAGSVV